MPNTTTVHLPTGGPAVEAYASLVRAITDGEHHLWSMAAKTVTKSRPSLPLSAIRALADDVEQEAIRRARKEAADYDPSRSALGRVIGFVRLTALKAVRRAGDGDRGEHDEEDRIAGDRQARAPLTADDRAVAGGGSLSD